MGDQQNAVSVFHFTDRISDAKLKKYHDSTSRGMTKPSGSHARKSTDASDSTASAEPPTKKPRLKLNGPRRESDEGGDTITVSRPRRLQDQNIRFKYSDTMVMTPASPVAPTKESPQLAPSPASSSGLSSLSSAPPSEKEASPFVDPEPAGRNDYGDFMSYYIDGGDEEPEAIPEAKTAVKVAAKKSRKSTPKSKASKAPPPPPNPAPSAVPNPGLHVQNEVPQPPQGQVPQQAHAPAPHQQHAAPFQQLPHQPPANAPQPQHGPSTHPRGLPHGRAPPQGPPRPHLVSQPSVRFTDIVHDPPPAAPDTVPTMIEKLEQLTLALTTFGGVPPAPPSSMSAASASTSPPPTPVKAVSGNAANPLDNFLSFFDADGDDEVELTNSGIPDGPLTHGIIFIQNALKSWAQQRVSQMYMQQYHHQLQTQQQSIAKRGPGRPRKFDEPATILPPSPIIQMELAGTPEGAAIKAFQAVLHSGCLRVNTKLPASLSRALRKLYMQIDLLINQGEREPPPEWQCMSYGAQISSHRTRVESWKEHQAKLQEETQRQRTLAQHNIMTQMGLPPQQNYPMTAAQAEHAHAVELETRRAQAHAHQQPYIRQQHLNPLQLGPHPSGPIGGFLPSQPVNNGGRPSSAGPSNGTGDSVVQTMSPNGVPTSHAASSSPGVQLDKMKLYVPGYLPRSGQNIKFSFSPQSGPAVSNNFAEQSSPNMSNVSNMGPMSAPPPSHASLQPPVDPINAPAIRSRPSTAPVSPDSTSMDRAPPARQSTVQSLTPAANADSAFNGNFRAHPSSQTPVVVTHGFTPVNAPTARASSAVAHSPPADTSPETIKVASKRSTGGKISTASRKRSSSEMAGRTENTTMPSKFPHPGAIVEDQ